MDALDPRHGTIRGVWAHKRAGQSCCAQCVAARQLYFRRTNKRRLLGYAARIPLGDRHAHLLALHESGITYQQLADRVGVSISTPFRWVTNGPGVLITPEMARRIDSALSVTKPTGVGILRRIQALMAIGYSGAQIAELAGLTEQTIQTGLRSGRTSWWASTASAIIATYDGQWNMPKSGGQQATRARQLAKKRGYLPPLAYDDIDDPNERPRVRSVRTLRTDLDHAVVERVLAGDTLPTTVAEKREITRRWEAQGRSLNELQRVTGWASHRYTDREAS